MTKLIDLFQNNNFINNTACTVFILLFINVFISIIPKFNSFDISNPSSSKKLRNSFFSLFLVVFIFLPLYSGLNIISFFKGAFGEFSVTSLFVLLLILRNKLFNCYVSRGDFEPSVRLYNMVPNRMFALIVFVCGLVLYSSYLGFLRLDIYELGYYPSFRFLLVLGILQLLLLFSARKYVVIWLIALICFYFKLQLSHNLWDYLFDPMLWIISFFRLFNFKN